MLLHTALVDEENDRSYLFLHPQKILSANDALSDALFGEIEQALADGKWVAGFFSYEYGTQLQGKARAAHHSATPEAWLGVYDEPLIFHHRTGMITGPMEGDAAALEATPAIAAPESSIHNLRFSLTEDEYAQKIAAIQDYIRAGDTYQVNFTGQLSFDLDGSPQALYASLIDNQPVAYGAYLNGGSWQVLSFSPELFFRLDFHLGGRRIRMRPMKGTAARGTDLAEDEVAANRLQNDPKNRSENVMIVDLLRNDLGRVCDFGSVHVDHLFSIEKYATLLQMTSEVSGMLRAGVSYSELFRSIFPSGSITGAPKLRTMEIIRELEEQARGVYTGAIGYFSPAGQAVFNVPIRTLVIESSGDALHDAMHRGAMGIGSGIVIDSRADDEYRECLLKAQFLTHREEPFELLESMLWDNGFPMLAMHLDRMEASARYFGFRFDRASVLSELEEYGKRLTFSVRMKVRVTLDRSGKVEVTSAPAAESKPGKVMVSAERVSSSDRFLRHKTTRRAFYDRHYRQAIEQGFVEVLFLNERDEVTEGAISNLFIEKEGRWFTPPIRCGALPGVYRRYLLASTPGAEERVLRLPDLHSADEIYLCNAVRGCTKVEIVVE